MQEQKRKPVREVPLKIGTAKPGDVIEWLESGSKEAQEAGLDEKFFEIVTKELGEGPFVVIDIDIHHMPGDVTLNVVFLKNKKGEEVPINTCWFRQKNQ